MDDAPELVHATAIACRGRAALIRGPAGAGKSDLALRCLGMGGSALVAEAALLVSDDQVLVSRIGKTLFARAPATIRGLIEVRGVGLVEVPSIDEAEVVLVVDLVGEDAAVERLPTGNRRASLLGIQLPVLVLKAFEASAAAKLLLALAARPGEPGSAR